MLHAGTDQAHTQASCKDELSQQRAWQMVLMAWRSACALSWLFELRIAGRYRLRPPSVSTKGLDCCLHTSPWSALMSFVLRLPPPHAGLRQSSCTFYNCLSSATATAHITCHAEHTMVVVCRSACDLGSKPPRQVFSPWSIA